MRHLHRLRLRHWRVQKGLLSQAQILFRFPQCFLLVCFPVIRPFPHRPINRTPLRTGTIQPHSFSVPQVSSWLQVVSKLQASYISRSVIQGGSFLSYLTRFLSLYLFPLFFRLPLFFWSPIPPLLFSSPPYGQGSILSPIPPILYILYIYYYSPSFLPPHKGISIHLFSSMSIIRIYIHSSIPPILFDSVLLLMWGGIVYSFMPFSFESMYRLMWGGIGISIHVFSLWFYVLFCVRRYRYIYLPPWTYPLFGARVDHMVQISHRSPIKQNTHFV